jgi:hypothetical protein
MLYDDNKIKIVIISDKITKIYLVYKKLGILYLLILGLLIPQQNYFSIIML